MTKWVRAFFIAACLLTTVAGCAQGLPQIVIVGTGHLDNPNRDMHNVKIDDVLTPKRQQELQQVVDALAKFKPTRIAIEADPANQAKWDARYADFRAGKYTLTRDERDQIGLRLAAQLHLPRVDAVDYQQAPPGPEDAYDFQAYAVAHGKQAELAALGKSGETMVKDISDYVATHTMLEVFQRFNTPQAREEANRPYALFPRMDDERGHPGANWVGGWHARNLIILENVRRLAKPGDRVLVIFGAGHSYLLTQFARESGAFDVVEPSRYLGTGK